MRSGKASHDRGTRRPPLLTPREPAFAPGEELYYIGCTVTLPSGNRLAYGWRGEALGPGQDDDTTIEMRFRENDGGTVDCRPESLSRSPPALLPGGFEAGERLFYTGSTLTLPQGRKVLHGWQGEVAGPASRAGEKSAERAVAMAFLGNFGQNVIITIDHLSRTAPLPIPGGFILGESLYYHGCSQTFPSGSVLVHGARGEVLGPSSATPASGKPAGSGLHVLFPTNKNGTNCFVTSLSRLPPPAMPGGFAAGDQVYCCNGCLQTSENRPVHGMQGEVVGLAAGEDVDKALKVKFTGVRGAVTCTLAELVRKPPPLPEKMGSPLSRARRVLAARREEARKVVVQPAEQVDAAEEARRRALAAELIEAEEAEKFIPSSGETKKKKKKKKAKKAGMAGLMEAPASEGESRASGSSVSSEDGSEGGETEALPSEEEERDRVQRAAEERARAEEVERLEREARVAAAAEAKAMAEREAQAQQRALEEAKRAEEATALAGAENDSEGSAEAMEASDPPALESDDSDESNESTRAESGSRSPTPVAMPLPLRLGRICHVLGIKPGPNLVLTARMAASAVHVDPSGGLLHQVARLEHRVCEWGLGEARGAFRPVCACGRVPCGYASHHYCRWIAPEAVGGH